MDLRTPLSKVKGSGTARAGTTSHVNQRSSAVIMIFLWLWFVSTTLCFLVTPDMDKVAIANSPYILIGYILFSITAIYHASFGLQMIIEDYIHCKMLKNFLLLAVKFFCVTSVIAGVLGGFVIHITSF